jgi:transcription initiation factor IIE alpha subunit
MNSIKLKHKFVKNGEKSMKTDKNLTLVAKIVLKGLENEDKPVKPEDLVKKLGIKLRSVRYGLKLLLNEKIIIRQPDLIDLRSYYYTTKELSMRNPVGIFRSYS